MSRTIIERVIVGKDPSEIQGFLSDWFSKNEFQVWDWHSDGRPFSVHDVTSFLGIQISPLVGNIIALRFDNSCVVFEIGLRGQSNGTLFHGEFYIAGWDVTRGQEFDLSAESGLALMARREGYKVAAKFLDELDDFAGQPFIEV